MENIIGILIAITLTAYISFSGMVIFFTWDVFAFFGVLFNFLSVFYSFSFRGFSSPWINIFLGFFW